MTIFSRSLHEIGPGDRDTGLYSSYKRRGCLERTSRQPLANNFRKIGYGIETCHASLTFPCELMETSNLARACNPPPHGFERCHTERRRICTAADTCTPPAIVNCCLDGQRWGAGSPTALQGGWDCAATSCIPPAHRFERCNTERRWICVAATNCAPPSH